MTILSGAGSSRRYSSEKYRDVEKKVEAPSRHEAFVLFESAKMRLNDVNNWQLLCGKSPAEFQLTDEEGNSLSLSAPQKGNLIKVRCYGNEKDKYTWYRVDGFIHEKNLLKDTEDFGFRVVQVPGPESPAEPHEGITCTFVVTRSGCEVSAVESGRSSKRKEARPGLHERIRERMQILFSWIAPSGQQWKPLINGVLQ